jgi:GDP-D-mannose 3',5'-epimerase
VTSLGGAAFVVTLPPAPAGHRPQSRIAARECRITARNEDLAMTLEFTDTIPGTSVTRGLDRDDLIVITGAGGFIAGSLTRYFHEQGYTNIRAIDRKPLPDWYLRVPGVESISMDLSHEQNAIDAVKGAVEVYNLAADMGGMGFIEHFRVECLRSILVNTHLTEASYRAGVKRYFFSSSACAYNTDLQKSPDVIALKESDAYPAMAERGYGWEKLISEMFCQEYWAERGLETHIARFHNIYGPNGTWFGGREKAPAAMCRKVLEAQDSGDMRIGIWGDGTQTRSFCYIDDCIHGIDRIMHSEELIATPINLGSSELVSINELVSIVEEIADVRLSREYELDAPLGVAGRNSDNTFIKQVLGWEPNTPLREGMSATYEWIAEQFAARKAGRRVVEG